jgi:hypothetical protein
MLFKLDWALNHGKERLWVEVLRSKYLVDGEFPNRLSSTAFQTLKGIWRSHEAEKMNS